MTRQTDKPFQFPTAENPTGEKPRTEDVEHEPSEVAIDQGVEESFPASDPVSVSVTKVERKDGEAVKKGG